MTATVAPLAGLGPGELLSGRPWIMRDKPFAHYLAADVFTSAFYRELVREYRELLGRGLAETKSTEMFSRMSGFDAYGFPLQQVPAGSRLSLFTSRPWHDLLVRMTGVPGSGHVRAGLHHHLPGSAAGGVHNDLNPGYFEKAAVPGEVVVPGQTFSYHHGLNSAKQASPGIVATVRALAVLIYLDNPGWQQGHGGETALYRDPRAGPVVLVPPKDNSMLIFECTPWSFHQFCSNPAGPRNSVNMWLHRPWPDAVQRWGEGAIVRW